MLVHGTSDSHPSRYMYCPIASTVQLAVVQKILKVSRLQHTNIGYMWKKKSNPYMHVKVDSFKEFTA